MLPEVNVSETRSPTKSRPTILVVEDEELIRLCMTEFLHDFGYHILEAANVAQAREILRTHPVDLIFSDINMPGNETGFDLEIWTSRNLPNIKVLLTSGYPQPESATKGLPEPLILKPYNAMYVIRRIQALLPETAIQSQTPMITN